MTFWDSDRVESANSFYWKTVLHRLYDRIVPYHPLMRHDVLDHIEKLEEIDLWLTMYKKEVDRIKEHRHLLLGSVPRTSHTRWERGVSLPESNEIEPMQGVLRGDDGTEVDLEDIPVFVPVKQQPRVRKARRRRRNGSGERR